jgi:two-component system cell cycle sensor histidine kinase/response regulator CckA
MLSSSLMQAKRAVRTILVVDDEVLILGLVRRVLEHGNYTVITSRNGDHAWSVVEQGKPKLDLVLTDIVMPGSIDGLTLAGKIHRKYRKLPVLFMTGALPENDARAVEMARKGLLLRKPFSPKDLVEFIDSH